MSEFSKKPVNWNETMDKSHELLEARNYTEFPYDSITADIVTSIVDDVVERADRRIESVVSSTDLTWDTIMAPLTELHDEGTMAYGRALFMAEVSTDKATRDTAVEGQMKVRHHATDLWYREDLYEQIKAYSETPNAQALEGEQARLMSDTLRDLRRMGHELEPAERQRMQELNNKLTDLGIAFEKNIREDKTFELLGREELDGMPDWWIDDLEQDDEGKFKVTMEYPHVMPFLEQANNRDARQKVSDVYSSRVIETNRPILEEAIKLRQEYAELLGYASWAHYQLEERMAKTPEAVKSFYADLIEPITAKGEAEVAVLTEMLHADGYDGELRKFDWTYYDAKLKERDHGINNEKIAEYFSLDAVQQGLFDITSEAFGIEIRELDIPTWHPDVKAYAIDDPETGEHIATFYMDLFPRDDKYGHAAAFTLQEGRVLPDGTYRKPESAIVANFTKPTGDRPSLLTYTEVTTFFHEFGHILHQVLTKAKMPEYAGTSVEGDFVEAPSQIMEHWVKQPEVLQRFAKHYKTGEPIPTELVEGIVAADKVNVAIRTLRQMQFGYFDMAIHDESETKDLDKILHDSTAIALLPHEPGTFFPATFGHLFGYDAGYYGYLYSEVYGDDMFSKFKQEGLTNPVVGMEYRRKILERGGTMDAIDMLRDFLGREPNNQAFLENQGIAS